MSSNRSEFGSATPGPRPTNDRGDPPDTLGRRPMTLRSKLIAGFVVTIIALSVVIGVVTQLFLSNYLLRQLDDRVSSLGQGLIAGQQPGHGPGHRPAPGPSDPNGVQLRISAQLCPDASDTEETTGPQPAEGLFAIVVDGTVTDAAVRGQFRSCTQLTSAQTVALPGISVGDPPQTVSLGDLGDFRVVAASASNHRVVVAGLSTDEVNATQNRLTIIMVIVAGSAVVLGGLLVWLIVSRSIRPLERVAATARKVTTLQLHRGEVDLGIRVPGKDTDPRTEIGQMGSALNQLLGHVSGALTARQESESRVRRFVADASHELRTPLASIRGYAELAGRNPDDTPAVRHALGRVRSESERMTTLVDDLLLLARIDAGRPLADEPVDLTLLTIDAVSDARVAGPEHRWLLHLPAEPLVVTGDGARLHQVLTNLLANARTHTRPGSTVTTGLRTERGLAVLTVTDDGDGIDDALQTEIFGRFVRGERSRSRAAGSTGLGLAIVSAVTAAHHGTVAVNSRPGHTVFTVRIPINRESSL